VLDINLFSNRYIFISGWIFTTFKVRKADVDSAEYVLTRMSVIKPRAPLTASQEIIMQTGVGGRRRQVSTKYLSTPTVHQPATHTHLQRNSTYLRGIQRSQEYQEFKRLLNLLTVRYKHFSNPKLAGYITPPL
jgi:hypothetical protein